MKRFQIGIYILIGLSCSSLLFGFQLRLPREIQEFQSVRVELIRESGDPEIESARFYVYEDRAAGPLYVEFKKSGEVWEAVVPGAYVRGDRMEYFAGIRAIVDNEPVVYLIPETGTLSAAINPDETPPELRVMLPRELQMKLGLPQTIIIHADDESGISTARIAINGQELDSVEITGNIVKAIYTPRRSGTLEVDVTVADMAGNEVQQVYNFLVPARERLPFLQASAEYFFDAEITVSATSKQEGHELPGELFDNLEYEYDAGFTVGGSGEFKAGPLAGNALIILSDSRKITEYLDVYPSTLISDYYDIMRLWHPWNFDSEFSYGEEDVRTYDNRNVYFAELSLLNRMLRYRFGDQNMHFQDQTVSNMPFRGTSLHLELPLLTLRAGKGLTDLGLFEQAWPRNFVGVQVGLDVFNFFYLQTNVSLISDFQGRYKEVSSAGKSDLGIMFDLVEYDDDSQDYTVIIKPASNLVVGLGTGLNLPWFEVKGEAGLTLYIDDASNMINIDALADQLAEEGLDFDITDYTKYIDMVEEYFPILDYFPLNLGIVTSAAAKNLWGITYGGDFSIPALGLETWFRKTDSSYRSLGASVTTDSMEYGGELVLPINGWRFTLRYNWDRNNIADILYNDLLVGFNLLSGDALSFFASTPPPVAIINHKASARVQTPNLGPLGRITGDYDFLWKTTNYKDFDDAESDHNESHLHTGAASWRSKSYRIGQVALTLGAKTKNTYTVQLYESGEESDEKFWDFSAEGSGRIGYRIATLSPSYRLDWSTRDESTMRHIVKASLSLRNLWFDTIGINGQWVEEFSKTNVWMERVVTAGLSLKKSQGIFSSGLDLTGGFIDSADPSENESNVGLKVWGGIRL